MAPVAVTPREDTTDGRVGESFGNLIRACATGCDDKIKQLTTDRDALLQRVKLMDIEIEAHGELLAVGRKYTALLEEHRGRPALLRGVDTGETP